MDFVVVNMCTSCVSPHLSLVYHILGLGGFGVKLDVSHSSLYMYINLCSNNFQNILGLLTVNGQNNPPTLHWPQSRPSVLNSCLLVTQVWLLTVPRWSHWHTANTADMKENTSSHSRLIGGIFVSLFKCTVSVLSHVTGSPGPVGMWIQYKRYKESRGKY